MNNSEKAGVRELAKVHWGYSGGLLEAAGADQKIINACAYTYLTAFEHGYKHAVEEMPAEIIKLQKQLTLLRDLLDDARCELSQRAKMSNAKPPIANALHDLEDFLPPDPDDFSELFTDKALTDWERASIPSLEKPVKTQRTNK